MGGPKALMMVGQGAWWRIQQQRLGGTPSLWVVSPIVEEALRAAPDAPAQRVLGDPAQPMFASVQSGLRAMAVRAPAFVHVLPVDVPAPSQRVYEALEGAALRAGVAAPSWEGVPGHPVCMSWAWVEVNVLDAGEGLDATTARLDELSAACRAVVPVDDPSVRVNLNTPEAVHAWEAWGTSGGQASGPRQ